MSPDRTHRLWRHAGLQVPRRRVASGRPRPWPPTARHHVWAYDFVFDTCATRQTRNCLTIVDEWTRECLAIDVAGGIRAGRVIELLGQRVSVPGAPRSLRSDHGLPQKSRRQSFSDLTMGSVDSAARRQAGSTLAESHADHSHTGSRPRPACPPRGLTERRTPGGRSEHYLRGRMRLDGPWRRDPPLGLVASGKRRSSMPVVTTALRDARHFGRDRRVPLPSPVRVLRIGADVVLELPAKPVLLHPDRHRAGHPARRIAAVHSRVSTGAWSHEIGPTARCTDQTRSI